MLQEKAGKIHEIKDTVTGAVEIMKQIRAPEMQDSLGKIMTTGTIVKQIIEDLKTPEMVKNIENLRVITENINEASTKIQDTVKMLDESGMIQETRIMVKSAKNIMNLVGVASKDVKEVNTAVKTIFRSVQVLVSDLKH
ncbi:hypothetical protein NSIN_20871 [Nitrosotalea sinensis]|uniref:Uncharacterized protein n=1 Tax=Nitrosotalea sinensis TaxID=1499975 RepID=A0A2H1EHY7_9ARCH|nr:hypothetical protein [Candidatus Nitrosotalea sinensis]SHO46049.1 hypothetical protein NSIN_20871 [Candidatus Nitrosotalea sinensis]